MIELPWTRVSRRWQRTSLRWKIAAVFANLLLLGAASQGIASYVLFRSVDEFARQQTHLEVAAALARKMQPLLDRGAPFSELKALGDELAVYNPDIALYLVASDGAIVVSLSGHSNENYLKIPVMPLQRLLVANLDDLPIYGVSPSSRDYRVFSVAAVTYRGERHYVYAVIDGADPFSRARSVAQDNSYAGQTGITLFLSIVVLLGIGAFALWLLGRRFERVMSGIRQYGKGETQSRLPVTGEDEIDQLSTTFNEMADRIALNIAELEHRDRLRRELIANVSHDLRSPLGHIRLTAEELERRSELHGAGEIQTLNSSIQVLEQLLRELFDLAKLEAEETQLSCVYYSVEDLLEDLVHRFRVEAKEKEIDLHTEYQEGLPMVYADPALISRAMGNLVGNALRYTQRGGVVVLRGSEVDGGVAVAVSDTGVGISTSELPKLFSRYYRGGEHRPAVAGSTGLGLAIVKRIVELHRSSIEVQSAPNAGTTFSFILPLQPAEGREEPQRAAG